MNASGLLAATGQPVRKVSHVRRAGAAFTLIELILVMTILTVTISLTAPALASFFRGRSLDSEARRLLALTRQGQSRAVSEGIPMELWFDVKNSMFGLEAEPTYEAEDARRVEFAVDPGMQIDLLNLPEQDLTATASTSSRATTASSLVRSQHPDLPRIRFMPDGSFDTKSPSAIVLTGRDGFAIALRKSRNGLSYELGAKPQ